MNQLLGITAASLLCLAALAGLFRDSVARAVEALFDAAEIRLALRAQRRITRAGEAAAAFGHSYAD